MRYVISLAFVVAIATAAISQDESPATSSFKRIGNRSDEDLRKELQLVPEIGMDQPAALALYRLVTAEIKRAGSAPSDVGVKLYKKHVTTVLKRPDMAMAPWRDGQDCQMGNEAAETLQGLSFRLRRNLGGSVATGDVRPSADKLAGFMWNGFTQFGRSEPKEDVADWRKPAALPTVLQLLQAESEPVRLVLITVLSKIEGKEASTAIAQRALFDLSPTVREKAVEALAKRPAGDYQKTLVDGFRWPWAPVAEHAAEAILNLDLTSAASHLVKALDEPDPRLPFVPADSKDKSHLVREVVKINHMSNCMLCHAPSTSKADLVRGRVPIPGEEPPPLYYNETSGTFVRADITYLRQDFSVIQPVLNAAKWPGNQRFDYVLRTRKANLKEMKLLESMPKEKLTESPQREAALVALRQMIGRDGGATADGWRPLLKAIEAAEPKSKAPPDEPK